MAKYDSSIIRQIVDEYAKGISPTVVVEKFGVPRTTVSSFARKAGVLRLPGRRWRDPLNHAAIIVGYQDGKSMNQLGQEHRTHASQICDILHRYKIQTRPQRGPRLRAVREDAFDDAINDPQAAYFVGLLMSDGCISGPCDCKISYTAAARDAKHVYKLKEFLKSEHSIYVDSTGKAKITICSDRLAKVLGKYGIMPRKSFTAKVLLLEHNRHFWRGAIDGDGMITWSYSNRFPTPVLGLVGSKALLDQFRDFCITIAPNMRASVRKMRMIWTFVTTGRYAKAIVEELYSDCEVAMNRKSEEAKRVLAWQPLRAEKIIGWTRGKPSLHPA